MIDEAANKVEDEFTGESKPFSEGRQGSEENRKDDKRGSNFPPDTLKVKAFH